MIKIILGDYTVVCDKCEKEFKIRDEVVYQSLYPTDNILNLTDSAKITMKGYPVMPNGFERFKDNHCIWHKACAPNIIQLKPGSIDDIKNFMLNLSDKENHQLYVFLHDSLGQRM